MRRTSSISSASGCFGLLRSGFLIHAKSRRRERGVVVDDSPNTIFEHRGAKIDKQAERLLRKAQIRQQLFVMYRRNRLNRFELNDENLIHEQIHSQAIAE